MPATRPCRLPPPPSPARRSRPARPRSYARPPPRPTSSAAAPAHKGRMRGALDFSSWHSLLTTLLGLAVVTLIMVGVRLLVMQTVQRRRERENRQINERLRTLIAAYKTLGGSFTGDLAVDPTHLKQLSAPAAGSERRRRIRDAVEAALSDIIL